MAAPNLYTLMSYQDQGSAATLDEANANLTVAKVATPPSLREYFQSKIQWVGAKPGNGYRWYWVVR